MKNTKLNNNKNTISESSVSTGRDAHIGDQYNISIDIGKFLLLIIILGVLFYVGFTIYQPENFDIQKTAIVETTIDDSLNLYENRTTPNQKKVAEDHEIEIPKTISSKAATNQDNSVSIGIKLINTEELLEDHANLILAKTLEKQGVISAKAGNTKNFDKILECQVKLYQEEVELGIQEYKQISFTLSGKILDAASGKILSSINEQSSEYHILTDSDLVKCLNKWLSSVNLDI